MKLSRTFYVVIITAILALAGFFVYNQYYLKDIESENYRALSRLSEEAVDGLTLQLAQSKMELDENLQKLTAMNKAIEALGKETLAFKSEIELLRREKDDLQAKITELVEVKTALEEKFHSLKELKKAIKIAKLKQRREDKLKRRKDRLAYIEMFEAMDAIVLAHGNRGYIIKEGEVTYRAARARIKVELEPIEKASVFYRETE